MSVKKRRRLSTSLKNDSSVSASPFSNSFVEAMMSTDHNSQDNEPLSFVQSLRMRMDEMERESAERQKAMAHLPHMKRFKTNMKKRQIQEILQEMSEDEGRNKDKKKRKRTSKFLVMTGVEKSIRETILAVVEQLGEYKVQTEVDFNTTHIVSAGKRRTVNILKAIITGCWILSVEWVLKSLEKGFWLKEDCFELTDFPAAKLMRVKRSSTLSPYHCVLLAEVGPIFVSPNTSPPSHEIVKLIKLSGGVVCGTARRATVCIGNCGKTDVGQVSEKWLLDCITLQSVLPFDEYQDC